MLGAIGVDVEQMIDREACCGGSFFLARLDGCIVELPDPAALKIDDAIKLPALTEVKYRLVAFEVVPHKQPCLFEPGRQPGKPWLASGFLLKSSALKWRSLLLSNRLNTLSRGKADCGPTPLRSIAGP